MGSDHHLVVASLKIKLAARKPFANTRRKFDVMKLRDPDIKQASQIELQTGLNQYSFKKKKNKE